MARLLLLDDQWHRIEPLLHGKASDRGVTAKDNRLFVEAILWIARTGAPWRDYPTPLVVGTLPICAITAVVRRGYGSRFSTR